MASPTTVVLMAGGLPVTSVGVCGTPAMDGVTVYDVIAEPPFPGADQETVADAFRPVAETPVGAPGAVGAAGVTVFDAVDTGPVPMPLVAVTVNVYADPFVRPPMVALVAGGLPDTVTGAWATAPAYGVTV